MGRESRQVVAFQSMTSESPVTLLDQFERDEPGPFPYHASSFEFLNRVAGERTFHTKDRGCSHPGCDVAGYWCEAHHCTPYAQSHATDVNDLTFGCGGHHPLAEQGWTTRKNQRGVTEWIPPPHLDHGRPRTNTFHHPEKLLCEDDVP
jgi:hypothetical protein